MKQRLRKALHLCQFVPKTQPFLNRGQSRSSGEATHTINILQKDMNDAVVPKGAFS